MIRTTAETWERITGARALALLVSHSVGPACYQQVPDDDAVPDGDADADGDADGDADVDADGDADDVCVDGDHDGAGVGTGCALTDCDDTDPRVIAECGEDCPSNPERTGCPCALGDVVPCYNGPPGTTGNGACAAGFKQCSAAGFWGVCAGQVLPEAEVETLCNDEDDNCDGAVDEGVLSACGRCFECTERCVGIGCPDPFDPEAGHFLLYNPDGSITRRHTGEPFLVWVPNSNEGTISKIDSRTREELGRFLTMPTDLADPADASPSRTAVHHGGDVVVSNRHVAIGGATRIVAHDCEDRDHDGQVATSQSGDDVLPWGQDECVAWYVTDIPRAVGTTFEERSELDGGVGEYVWVSSSSRRNDAEGTLFEIDAVSGEKTGRTVVNTPGFGLAMAPGGILWALGRGQCPRSIDTVTLEWTVHDGCGFQAYGLAVDSEGRPWIGGGTGRLNLETGEWQHPVDGLGTPFPIGSSGITLDGFGNAYTGDWQGPGGVAYRIDRDTLVVTPLPGMGGRGWTVDVDGFVWAVDTVDAAHVMDPDTLEVRDVRPPFVGPDAYSDMASVPFSHEGDAHGIYYQTFEPCPLEGPFYASAIVWDADLPEGAALGFRIRFADTIEGLEAAPWIAVGSSRPADSRIPLSDVLAAAGADADHLGQVVMIEVVLLARGGARPTLRALAFEYACAGDRA